jgi:hypothetical protein
VSALGSSASSVSPLAVVLGHDARRAALIVSTIIIGLYLDQAIEIWGQLAVSVWTWGVFLWLLQSRAGSERRLLLVLLVVCTAVEIFSSMLWQVYTYRLDNVPAFVPPGHVLLFVLGSMLATRIPAALTWLLPLLAAPYALHAHLSSEDSSSFALFLVFAFAMCFSKAKRLYAAMFLLSLALELYGTWLGNWRWSAVVPGLGLTAANPPRLIGAAYCLLDMLVLFCAAIVDSRFFSITGRMGRYSYEYRPERQE